MTEGRKAQRKEQSLWRWRDRRKSLFTEGGVVNRHHIKYMTDEVQMQGTGAGFARSRGQRGDNRLQTRQMQMRDST